MAFGRVAVLLATARATLVASLAGSPNSDPRREIEQISAKIHSVDAISKDMRKHLGELSKHNAKKRNELMKEKEKETELLRQKKHEHYEQKLTTSTERNKKLNAAVEQLQSTKRALSERTDEIRTFTAGVASNLHSPAASKEIAKSTNDELAAKLASVEADSRELRAQASHLAKHNIAKRSELLAEKLAQSTDRKKKLSAAVERLAATSKVLSERADGIEQGHAGSFQKTAAAASAMSTEELKSKNSKLTGRIAAVDASSKDMKTQATDLVKQNVEKRNELLKGKLVLSKERKEKLTSSVEQLKNTNEVLSTRADKFEHLRPSAGKHHS